MIIDPNKLKKLATDLHDLRRYLEDRRDVFPSRFAEQEIYFRNWRTTLQTDIENNFGPLHIRPLPTGTKPDSAETIEAVEALTDTLDNLIKASHSKPTSNGWEEPTAASVRAAANVAFAYVDAMFPSKASLVKNKHQHSPGDGWKMC